MGLDEMPEQPASGGGLALATVRNKSTCCDNIFLTSHEGPGSVIFMTRRYFRIQPAGLGLDHRSETSNGELADGLHVFWYVHQALRPDGSSPKRYGNEIVIVEASREWPNDDVEGVCIDGKESRVVARIPTDKFVEMCDDESVDQEWDANEFCTHFGIG